MQINIDDRKALALGENISLELYGDMSTDVGTQNDLATGSEQSEVFVQQNNFLKTTINSVETASKTNLVEDYSGAVIKLSENFKRISEIASQSKTVDTVNAMKKFNETLDKITIIGPPQFYSCIIFENKY